MVDDRIEKLAARMKLARERMGQMRRDAALERQARIAVWALSQPGLESYSVDEAILELRRRSHP